MHRLRKYRVAALALMLVLSQVALAAHITAHFHPQLDECELCVSQAHPMAAIPPSQPLPPVAAHEQQTVFSVPAAPDGAWTPRAYHQRAPPRPSH